MRLGEVSLQEAAELARGNWREFSSFGWHGRPEDCNEFAIVYTHNRDSGLLDQSNAAEIKKALVPFMEGDNPDIIPERHGHWACGWVDGFAIRVSRNGEITHAFCAYHELAERLADYPVLNEEDFSQREYDATLENIRSEGHSANSDDSYCLPEDWVSATFTWLWNNDQSAVECRDDGGGYPSKDELRAAWDGLGYRILYAVTCIDCGEETEEFQTEEEAQERVDELRAAGFLATYREVTPQPQSN